MSWGEFMPLVVAIFVAQWHPARIFSDFPPLRDYPRRRRITASAPPARASSASTPGSGTLFLPATMGMPLEPW